MNIQSGHPERSGAIREANRCAQSRDLLFAWAHGAAWEKQIPPRAI